MYGLVNRAIEALICRNFGEETWEAMLRRRKQSLKSAPASGNCTQMHGSSNPFALVFCLAAAGF